VHVLTENRIHHPLFEVGPLNAGRRTVVLDSKNNPSAPSIGQSHRVARKLFRSDIVARELRVGTFARGKQPQKLRLLHSPMLTPTKDAR
jgi:hypothetical protein